MSWVLVLGDVVFRAAYLVALAIAPPFLHPEPEPTSKLLLHAAVSLVLLAAAAYGALRLRAARGGVAASSLIVASLIAAVACAAIFRGDRAPLGRGILFVAVPLWAGMVITVGALAGRLLGPRARLAASLIVAGVGVLSYGRSARWIFSPEQMWARCLEGGDPLAIDALTRDQLRAGDYRGAIAALDRCLEANPQACACLAKRAEVRTQVPGADRAMLDAAVADARAAAARCQSDRATIAIAIALRGDGAEAEKEAREALKDDERSGRLHYALALALDREGRSLDALAEALRAVELGAGRDAELLLGARVSAAGDLGGAEHAAEPLTGGKGDAPVLYGRALIAEKLSAYDKAREGYFMALNADPTFASARYTLALLALRHGVLKEARRHAATFAKAFPDDPRNAELERMIPAAPQK